MNDIRAGHDGGLGYHQRMLSDPHRMVAYERALRAAIRPGDVVLDVGAGTGLLSIWAARLGARVHAVESMSIGDLIVWLARQHGVAEQITVHRADMRTLPVAEPVDWIVSECLGRFLIDDGMLEAMHAAMRWLKPGGGVIPRAVELVSAPLELLDFAPLDDWTRPSLGFDVTPLATLAEHQTYGLAAHPSQLLAAPLSSATWRPGELAVAFAPLDFTVARAGRLRGVAGWFRADLDHDVMLTNAPGFDTHWQQLLLPLPPRRVEEGEVVRVSIASRSDLFGDENHAPWHWQVELRGEIITRHDAPDGHEIAVGRAPIDPHVGHAQGEEAFERGDFGAAAEHFNAVLAAMPLDDDDAAPIWENVGLAYHATGAYEAAIAPLMRALDGGDAREQSLRLLVESTYRVGRMGDFERWLAVYEARFGPHPMGFTLTS